MTDRQPGDPIITHEHAVRVAEALARGQRAGEITTFGGEIPGDPAALRDRLPDGAPAWARDCIYTDVRLSYSFMTRLFILIGGNSIVRVRTFVERPPGRTKGVTKAEDDPRGWMRLLIRIVRRPHPPVTDTPAYDWLDGKRGRDVRP